jgi:hypothetical protein
MQESNFNNRVLSVCKIPRIIEKLGINIKVSKLPAPIAADRVKMVLFTRAVDVLVKDEEFMSSSIYSELTDDVLKYSASRILDVAASILSEVTRGR